MLYSIIARGSLPDLFSHIDIAEGKHFTASESKPQPTFEAGSYKHPVLSLQFFTREHQCSNPADVSRAWSPSLAIWPASHGKKAAWWTVCVIDSGDFTVWGIKVYGAGFHLCPQLTSAALLIVQIAQEPVEAKWGDVWVFCRNFWPFREICLCFRSVFTRRSDPFSQY